MALLFGLTGPVGADEGSDLLAAAQRVLANADYRCAIQAGAGSGRFADDGFTLNDGTYTGRPSVPGSSERPEAGLDREHVAVGDVDGDGKLDAVAPVYDAGEGTGVFWTANVFSDVLGKPRCTHAIFLGDRVDVHSIEIQPPDSIIVDMNDHGPDDGMAQRTMSVRRKYQLTAGGVAAFQQLPGKVWTSYRPESWAVTKAAAAPPSKNPVSPLSTSPLGTSEAARAVWRIVTLSAAGGLRDSGTYEMALEAVQKPRRGDQSRARSLNEQGIGLLRADRYPEAIASLRDAAVADPGDAEVLNNLAYALLLDKQHSAAADAIVAALVAAPSRWMAWETLGQILVALGHEDAAVGAFRAGLLSSGEERRARDHLERLALSSKNPAVVTAIRTALSWTVAGAPALLADQKESARPPKSPTDREVPVVAAPDPEQTAIQDPPSGLALAPHSRLSTTQQASIAALLAREGFECVVQASERRPMELGATDSHPTKADRRANLKLLGEIFPGSADAVLVADSPDGPTLYVLTDISSTPACTHSIEFGTDVRVGAVTMPEPMQGRIFVELLGVSSGQVVNVGFGFGPSSVVAFQQPGTGQLDEYKPRFWSVSDPRSRRDQHDKEAKGDCERFGGKFDVLPDAEAVRDAIARAKARMACHLQDYSSLWRALGFYKGLEGTAMKSGEGEYPDLQQFWVSARADLLEHVREFANEIDVQAEATFRSLDTARASSVSPAVLLEKRLSDWQWMEGSQQVPGSLRDDIRSFQPQVEKGKNALRAAKARPDCLRRVAAADEALGRNDLEGGLAQLSGAQYCPNTTPAVSALWSTLVAKVKTRDPATLSYNLAQVYFEPIGLAEWLRGASQGEFGRRPVEMIITKIDQQLGDVVLFDVMGRTLAVRMRKSRLLPTGTPVGLQLIAQYEGTQRFTSVLGVPREIPVFAELSLR